MNFSPGNDLCSAEADFTEQPGSKPVVKLKADGPVYHARIRDNAGSVTLATQWFPALTIFVGVIFLIIESTLALPWLLFGFTVTVVTYFVMVASRCPVIQLFRRN